MKRTTSNAEATTSNARRTTSRKPAPVYNARTGRLNLTPAADLPGLMAQVTAAYESGFAPVNAAAAYLVPPTVWAVETPELPAAAESAARNLANIVRAVQGTLANMGKGTGVSSIYNVIDGRTCHKVTCRKLAERLGNSRKLAAFIDTLLAADMQRNGVNGISSRTSGNGVTFECDRRQYTSPAAVNA